MAYFLDRLERKLDLPKGTEVVSPPPKIKADLAVPVFQLSKKKIAEKIRSLKNCFITAVQTKGGYVNINLDINKLAAVLIGEILEKGESYGLSSQGNKRTVFIEYSSPNIAKPLHIGHLRNTVLGTALANIYRAGGYRVLTENWLGDWGKQYGLLMLAYKKWGREEELKKNPARYLFRLYTRINKAAAGNNKINEEASNLFYNLEKGDRFLFKLWKKLRAASIRDFKRTYQKLKVKFDFWRGEYFYTPFMKAAIAEALKKKAAYREKGGPVVVDLNRYGLRSYLLLKTDGASLYDARDLAAARYRLRRYHPAKIVYVVGREQELHFKQMFKTLELMGYSVKKLTAVFYGLVTMAGSKMSSRAGNIVFLDDLLDEAVKRAKGKRAVGIGAVIYNMLSRGNEKNISFEWERALSLRGDSAPYIQYAYVRALGILRKIPRREKLFVKTEFETKSASERELVKALLFYPRMISKARENNSPHFLAVYLNDLAQRFNRFYEENPVLKAVSEREKRQRVVLTRAAAQIIKNGLGLLGIKAPARM